MQTSAQKHYALNRLEINAKNNAHQKSRRYAENNGFMLRSQAARHLDITVQQLTNVEKSVNSNGQVHVYMDEKGKTYYTEDGIENWLVRNREFYNGLKKRTLNLVSFSEDFMSIVEFMRVNSNLSEEMIQLRTLKEKQDLYARYAA